MSRGLIKMNDHLELFAQQIQKIRNPRERRGFLDSFYASLIHGKIDRMTAEEIERAATILENNAQFTSHARVLRTHIEDHRAVPGADLFFAYLAAQAGQDIRVTGPEVLGTSYGIDSAKRYLVLTGDVLVGQYYEYGPKLGESEVQRHFWGQIPGYVNECVVVHNRHLELGEKPMPENLVSLVWANERFEMEEELYFQKRIENIDGDKYAGYSSGRKLYSKGHGRMVDTPWQRQDGHDQIPFP